MSSTKHADLDQELESAGVQCNVSLQEFNTLGFSVSAEYFATAKDDQHLKEILDLANERGWNVFVLGSGSNLVLTKDIAGLVLRVGSQQIDWAVQADSSVHVTVGSGVNWHSLVLDTLDRGYAGLENLSLIPGTVGAAPVQNIGAYGVELSERLVRVEAWHRPTGRIEALTAPACRFGYRDSRFKQELDEWIILRSCFRLHPEMPVVTSYGALETELAQDARTHTEGSNNHSSVALARRISDAVIRIRSRKLPDPAVFANAGSFFHNPVVSHEVADKLLHRHPCMVYHTLPDGQVKLAAGWLIDNLGYKGRRFGPVGVHDAQALVLVHHGNGDGQALLALAEEIAAAVRASYGVELTIEPRVM